MGVEDGETHHNRGEQSTVPPKDHLVQTPAPQHDGEQRTEGWSVAVPVTVVSRDELEALQRQLVDAQAKLERQRLAKNERQQRWRDANREHVRQYDRERKRKSGR